MADKRRTGVLGAVDLTAVQQDYLEGIYSLMEESSSKAIRVTDLADKFGTKSPTVVRTLTVLKSKGLVKQDKRGLVELTESGHQIALQFSHRHKDTISLLVDVLGVPTDEAELEACIIEHGLSGITAERLHHFLKRFKSLPEGTRRRLRGRKSISKPGLFNLVGQSKGAGKRQ